MNNRNVERTKRIVLIAMFSALAYVTTVICKLIPECKDNIWVDINLNKITAN